MKWGPLYTVHVLVSSQTVTQAGQSVACLKCLVDVKQLICSFFLTDFFEISQFIHRYCFLYFLKTPYLNSCEKSNLAGVLLRSARLPAFLGCLLPCCLWAASWPVAPPRTGAQDTFVTSGFQLLRAESEWTELAGITYPLRCWVPDWADFCPHKVAVCIPSLQSGAPGSALGALEHSSGAPTNLPFRFLVWITPFYEHFLTQSFSSGIYLKLEQKTLDKSVPLCQPVLIENCHPSSLWLHSQQGYVLLVEEM